MKEEEKMGRESLLQVADNCRRQVSAADRLLAAAAADGRPGWAAAAGDGN